MNSRDDAVLYYARKVYYQIIKYLVQKELSPEEIIKELKKIRVYKEGTKKSDLKRYIRNELRVIWDEDEKKWKEDKQVINSNNLINYEDDIQPKFLASNLSENDIRTILKDIKTILSNSKTVVKRINDIAENIDSIVAGIGARYQDTDITEEK